jgi:hypothetical protein
METGLETAWKLPSFCPVSCRETAISTEETHIKLHYLYRIFPLEFPSQFPSTSVSKSVLEIQAERKLGQ